MNEKQLSNGKIYKITFYGTYQDKSTPPTVTVGILYAIESGGYRFCTVTGNEIFVSNENLISVTSTRLPTPKPGEVGVRQHLLDIYHNIHYRKSLQEKIAALEVERRKVQYNIDDTKSQLLETMGYYRVNQVCDLATGHGLRVTSYTIPQSLGCKASICLCDERMAERYDYSEKHLPFIHQRSDDNSRSSNREYAPQAYDAYAQRNAPAIRVALSKLATNVTKDVEVNDKWVTACTNYYIDLPYGYRKEDIDKIFAAARK